MKHLCAILLVAMPGASHAQTPPAVPRFVEETATAGVNSIYTGDWEYMVGGGAAAFDCNSDGFADLLLAGGTGPAAFYRNQSAVAGPLRFVAETSGLELDRVTGAYPLDIDSDRVTDIVLLRVGQTVAMRGLGDCRFERANEVWGFSGGDAWTTAFAATWERGAVWPTLAVGTYIDRTEDAFPWGSCTDNRLYRPASAGTGFAAPLALNPSHCALSMLFTDWNRSGTPALRVSNDREYYKGGQEQLWRLDPGAPPLLFTAEDGWKPLRIWGMGIASQDLNLDGYPEYFLTSMADNKLQTLAVVPETGPPAPTYADVAFARGVTAHRPYTGGEIRPSTAWHAEFQDVNNDGLADLFVAKGNVSEMPDFAMKDPNNLLLQDAAGQFHEAGDRAGVASLASARGAALADFNLDGWVDLVVVNRHTAAQVWRNTGPTQVPAGQWLQLRPQQPGANPDAVNGWVEVRRGETVMRREITVGGGHAGGQTGWVHFGLGDSTEAEVRVIWPDGMQDAWQSVAPNTFHILNRGGTSQVWVPAR